MSKRTENERIFRAANEQLLERLGRRVDVIPFLCECSDDDCFATIELPVSAYESVRAAGERRFFVLPGHEGNGEQVVDRNDSYLEVEKT